MKRRRRSLSWWVLWLLPLVLPVLLSACGFIRDEFWSLDRVPPDTGRAAAVLRDA